VTLSPAGNNIGALYQKLYIQCSWGWASLTHETCRADLKRSINGICCILLVAYIVVLMKHGVINIKLLIPALRRASFIGKGKNCCFASNYLCNQQNNSNNVWQELLHWRKSSDIMEITIHLTVRVMGICVAKPSIFRVFLRVVLLDQREGQFYCMILRVVWPCIFLMK